MNINSVQIILLFTFCINGQNASYFDIIASYSMYIFVIHFLAFEHFECMWIKIG